MNPDRSSNYSEIRPKLKTGDVVLFQSGKWWSPGTLAIRLGTWSRWSHVGMIVHLRKWDLVLLLESNTSDSMTDITIGQGHKGVQLLSFSEVVRKYQGKIAIRQLEFDDPPDEDSVNQPIAKFRRSIKSAPYEKKLLEMALIPFRFAWDVLKPDKSSLFCSELVAEALKELGVLNLENRPSSTFAPKDFQDDTPNPLPIKAGAKLGDEIWI